MKLPPIKRSDPTSPFKVNASNSSHQYFKDENRSGIADTKDVIYVPRPNSFIQLENNEFIPLDDLATGIDEFRWDFD